MIADVVDSVGNVSVYRDTLPQSELSGLALGLCSRHRLLTADIYGCVVSLILWAVAVPCMFLYLFFFLFLPVRVLSLVQSENTYSLGIA